MSPSQFQEFLQRFYPVERFVSVTPGYQEQLSSRMDRQEDLNFTSQWLQDLLHCLSLLLRKRSGALVGFTTFISFFRVV